MTLLVAYDPGKNTGWAVFQDGILIASRAGSWVEMFEAATVFVDTLAHPHYLQVLGELPMVYPGPRPEDPNDLIVLAEQLGELLSIYRARGCGVETVHPRTWKGTVPKRYHQPRIRSRLTVQELVLIPQTPRSKKYDHNAVDAVGLGLWKLGRMHG